MMKGFLGKFIAMVALIAIAALMETEQVAGWNPYAVEEWLKKRLEGHSNSNISELVKKALEKARNRTL
ncbi:hypothetical protein MTO96_016253 [Rhipicephalus appendiculatus]